MSEIATISNQTFVSLYRDGETFDHGQRVAQMLAKSDLVPAAFKNKVANTMIALQMANRMGSDPMMVMQNMHIIHGKPSFSSQFLIALLNASGKFSSLTYKITGKDDALSCICSATEVSTGQKLEGPAVNIKMAKDEGWHGKAGSKWKTMPELMLRYRAASFFIGIYAPELKMGLQTSEEIIDIGAITNDREDSQYLMDLNSTLKDPSTSDAIFDEVIEDVPEHQQEMKTEPEPDQKSDPGKEPNPNELI